MATEIPTDQITQLQISLRNQSGFGSYNPNHPSLSTNYQSLGFDVSELDPSPDYLRCKSCKGRLLRGINSFICVFCGEESKKDLTPEPLKFFSTIGCRWFLDSLQLDGSEMVQPPAEEYESNKGQNSRPPSIPLSELLDLEIRWPSQSERGGGGFSDKMMPDQDQKLSSLNMGRVDLDNFFSDSKMDSVPASSGEELAPNKHDDGVVSSTYQADGNLSLFENVQPSQIVGQRKEDESADSFSGWDTDFHSAGSVEHKQESRSFNAFAGSSSSDLSAHMDAIFGPVKELSDRKPEANRNIQSSSEDWLSEDLWSSNSSNILTTSQGEVATTSANDTTGKPGMNSNNSSLMNIDLIQDDQCQATSSQKATGTKFADEQDVPFDDWNDFTSSTAVQAPSSSSSKQDDNLMTSSFEQPSIINFFEETRSSKDPGFGAFSEPDFFSATFNNQNGSREADLQPTTYISDRMTDSISRNQDSDEGAPNENKTSTTNDVAELVSQMHDLSFMLKSNLSIPQKIDSQKKDHFASFQME